MSDSDYDDFDDDDELIALTLKPLNIKAAAVETTAQQQPNNQVHEGVNQTHTQSPLTTDLVVARGEIAVLRAKLQEIEKAKRLEREELLSAIDQEKIAKESKIKALESSVQRLEDERKFLSVEVRNLNSKKKRKRISEDFQTQDVDMSNSFQAAGQPATIDPETVQVPHIFHASRPAQEVQSDPMLKQSETIRIQPQVARSDNVTLVDNITNHTIIGLSKPSMDFLNKICLHNDYKSELLFIPRNDSISNSLLRFFLQQKNIPRLDHFVSIIVKELVTLLYYLLETNDKFQYLPIPFILSLIHATLIFRPSAISKEVKKLVIELMFRNISRFEDLLKPSDLDYSEYYERHKKIAVNVIHFKLIEEMSLQFSLELLETIMINIDLADNEFNLSLVKSIETPLLDFMRLILSNKSCISLIFPLIEILSSSLALFEDQEKFPLVTDDIVSALLLLVYEGIEWKQDWLFGGLNRIIGNNTDSKSVESLVGDSLSQYPKVVYPIEYKSAESLFKVQNQHDIHLINLQLEILVFLEKYILNIQSGVELLNTDSKYLKMLVHSIAKQQEYMYNVPRDNLTHLRSKSISSMMRVLHLLWELTISGTDQTSPLLPKDLTHILIVVLSRIAFSNTHTGTEAAKFLYSIREKGIKKPVFNRWAEERAREVSHMTTLSNREKPTSNEPTSDFALRSLVHAEVSYSNGLEFAYDDDVVELARDILEKCITMEESDDLFFAMNTNL